MVPSKTYLKFKETRSQEDLNTLNKYLKRLSEISSKLNNDALELSDEEENKLYDEESLELDLMDILNQMDLLRGCDDQYFDYNVDEVDMVLYGATIIQEQEKYKPLIMQKFQHYKDNFDEEEHAEEIDYYLNFLEEPETLYTFTENIISLFKSFIK